MFENISPFWLQSAPLIAVGLLFGLSAALLAWLVTKSATEVPEDDRTYLDPPPLGFRLVWFPIRWVAFIVSPFMAEKNKLSLAGKLRSAGQEFTLNPEQFVAAKIICAVFCMLLAAWLANTFGLNLLLPLSIAALIGWLYPAIWLRDQIELRRRELLKGLPFFLDLITLCVEAGLNLQGAIAQAVQRGPAGPFKDELQRLLRDVRAGKSRAEALRALADRSGEAAVSTVVSSLIQAENLGMNLGPVLRAQAEQRRSERFLRAEKLAMQAPVKMLFPLLFFIMPCAMAVILFPIAMKLLQSGFF
jgi:tight adherence protein C